MMTLRECIGLCRNQFRLYECNHRQKQPPDLEKAETNGALAAICESALAAPICDHDFSYDGLQFKDDQVCRSGSGATTIHYFQVYHCRHCLEVVKKPTDWKHSSLEKVLFGATPVVEVP